MSRFEISTVTLSPVSPIHISAGGSNDGAADLKTDNREIIVIDEGELANVLDENSLLQEYVVFAENWLQERGNTGNMIHEFFRQPRIRGSVDFDEVKERICPPNALRYRVDGKDRFIRDAHGRPFIPGSSLKGAIRTAVILQLLQEYQHRIDADYLNTHYLHSKFFDSRGSERRPNRKTLDDELVKLVFEDYDIAEPGSTRAFPKRGSTTDFMRAISVSDSSPIDMSMETLAVQAMSLDRTGRATTSASAGNHELFYDFGSPDNQPTVSLTITIDHEILSYFGRKTSREKNFSIPFQTIADIQMCLESYSKAVWHEERMFFYGYPVEAIDPDTSAEEEYASYRESLVGMIANGQKREFVEWILVATNFQVGQREANEVTEKSILNPGQIKELVVPLLARKYRAVKRLEPIPPHIQSNAELVNQIVEFYKSEQAANIRLGYGSGLFGTTHFPMVSDAFRKKIRNLTKDFGDLLAPSSRRLVIDDNGSFIHPLGWARLEFSPPINEFGEPWQ